MAGEPADLEATLGPRFAVLTGYRPPGSRGPFGHVVIGPSGVFLVEPFDGRGTLRVRDGEVTLDAEPFGPIVQRVRRQAFALQLLLADALAELDLRVAPILWARAARLRVRRVAGDVRMATTRDLRRRIVRGGTVLPAVAVRRLMALAEARLIPAEGLSA
jgi:hypothetical protein